MPDIERLKEHARTHISENYFHCDIAGCKKSFQSHKYLGQHKRIMHKPFDPEFTCQICDKEHRSDPDLKKHMHLHDRNRKFECDICNWRFEAKSNMKVHQMNKHGIGP